MAATPLIESSTRHSVYLEGLKGGQLRKFGKFLAQMDKSIRDRLGRDNLTDFSRNRLERLLKKVDEDLDDILGRYKSSLFEDIRDIAEYEAGFEARSIAQAIPDDIPVEVVLPAVAQVRAAVFSNPLGVQGPDGGSLLEPFVDNFTQGERRRITNAIRQGFFEGKTTPQIIQDIRGTRAKGFQDGILGMTSRKAEAIVRTGVAHAAQTARMETMQENADILKGYRWISTLDGRTSPQCRSLDNQVFPLDKGPRPPIHIRCRSSMAPELADEFQALTEGETRASKDGPVDAGESYYSWLKKQPPEFIEDVLGKERANLLLNGGLSADQFAKLNLGRNFRPLTLDEMRQREPLAFARAEAAAAGARVVPKAKPKPRTQATQDAEAARAAKVAQLRQEAWEYTTRKGKRRGQIEYAMVTNEAGEEILRRKGGRGNVPFYLTELNEWEKRGDVTIFHNHPGNATLSDADFLVAARGNLKAIVAFGSDEAAEYIGWARSSRAAIERGFAEVDAFLDAPRWRALAIKAIQEKRLTNKEAHAGFWHMRNMLMDRAGLVGYRAPVISRETEKAMEYFEPFFELWETQWKKLRNIN